MSKRCLYCYQPLNEHEEDDFHERCSLKFFGTKTPPVFNYSLNEMAELAKNVVERSVAVPGVQPKLSLTIVNDTLADGRSGRLTVVGALGGNYIFKPPSDHFAEMPQNEHVTMRIAEDVFKLRTVPSSLIRLASGELAYITRRIDRTSTGEKIHMLDMFQILEAFDKYKGSMERIGKALQAYSANTLLDLSYYFELTLFSYLTGNSDMHLKNFSMINNGGNWELSPAYDLLNVTIVNPSDTEELALTLEGRKKKLRLENFNTFARNLGMNDRQLKNVYSRFSKNKQSAFDWLDQSFLSAEQVEAYKALMDKRYAILPEVSKPTTAKKVNIQTISCVSKKASHYDAHERIAGVGGLNDDNSRWKMGVFDVINAIEQKRIQFQVSIGGKMVPLVVAVHNGIKYLKTATDGYSPDNLLHLPECP